MRKIYIVPNLVTTANMFAGFYSIIASIKGEFHDAAWAILAAAVFDMLDGRIARMAKATSQFGVEYDSLSDLMSFGMAPALFLHQLGLHDYGRLGWLAAFLYLVCGALRLARFNVTTHALPKGYFQGLPIPIAAGLIATFFIFREATEWEVPFGPFALGLAFSLASLMVSSVRFPSFKELNWRSRASFSFLAIGVLSMVLIAARPEIALFLLISAYIVFGLLANVYRALFRRSPIRVASHPSERGDENG